jgi:hypothetical protein
MNVGPSTSKKSGNLARSSAKRCRKQMSDEYRTRAGNPALAAR